MKKQKLHETTLPPPPPLPELPPEVWCIIMHQITNRGNPWLAGRLKAICLSSSTCHAAGYQARLLMAELRHGFPSTVYLGRGKQAQIFAYALMNNMRAYTSLQRFYYRRPIAKETGNAKATRKHVVEEQLIELEFALRRCGKAMAASCPFNQDVTSYYGRIHGHVDYWWTYKTDNFPKSDLFIRSGLTQACTPRILVRFNLAEAETTNMAEAAKWFSWTMASFASYHALELLLMAQRGLGDRAATIIAWDEWDRKTTLAFVHSVTQLKPPTWPDADVSVLFEAVVYLRQDNTPVDFFGMTVHLNATGGVHTEFFGDH